MHTGARQQRHTGVQHMSHRRLTRFIDCEAPARPSVALWANLAPTGRASQKAANCARTSMRVGAS